MIQLTISADSAANGDIVDRSQMPTPLAGSCWRWPKELNVEYSDRFRCRVADAAEVLDRYGFVIFDSGLEHSVLQQLSDGLRTQALRTRQPREPGGRWCLNSSLNFEYSRDAN